MSPISRSFASLLLFFSAGLINAAAGVDHSRDQPLSSPPFLKTSFDCARSRSFTVEEAICKNEELAKLDIEVAAAYGKRLESASSKDELVRSQREWLKIRNSYDANPYHDDWTGVVSDISQFYRDRIAALGSDERSALQTRTPAEYAWLRSVAGSGFNKDFSMGREYMGCTDPCEKTPFAYRWISIWSGGVGDGPGDVDTPYKGIAKRLAAEGWKQCRTADDSGKPSIEYFSKGEKIVEISRYYSMGVGNSIVFGVTTSGPLHRYTQDGTSGPAVVVGPEWVTYSIPELGLTVKHPPNWHVRDTSPGGLNGKFVQFEANDFTANFTIEARLGESARHWPRGINDEGPELSCGPSLYQISRVPAEQCVISGEQIGGGICVRSVYSEAVKTSRYALRFEPGGGTVPDGSGKFRLNRLYEKILETIEIREDQ